MEEGIDVGLEVTGVAETLKALAKTDPELRKAVIKDMKTAARPLEAAARALVPVRPLTNWYGWRGGYQQPTVQRGIKVAFRAGKVRGKPNDHFPLLSLRQTNAGGAIFDMAGRTSRGKTPAGEAMIRKLDEFGTASRTLWPAVERNFGVVEDGLKTAIDSMSDEINKQILKGA